MAEAITLKIHIQILDMLTRCLKKTLIDKRQHLDVEVPLTKNTSRQFKLQYASRLLLINPSPTNDLWQLVLPTSYNLV
jgi:hypothetical protein